MKQILLKTCMLFTVWASLIASGNAQVNIVAGEYFFDTDPGYGNGTSISIGSPSPNIASLLVNASTTSLSNGVHTLFLRTRDANGKWSMTNTFYFAKVQALSSNSNSVSNINKMEYFYDIDPGFGNGTDIPVTASSTISSLLISVNVASLSNGVHTLFIRSRDSLGKWSMTNNLYFAKVQLPTANPYSTSNINKLEYFYDVDPGYGSGTDIPVTAAINISNLLVNVSVASLPNGVHTLYLRSRDAQGKWSITNNFYFAKVQPPFTNPYTASNINKVEYFYDVDPGYGNGVNVPVTPSVNMPALVINTDVSLLSNGVHTLYIRTRDSLGLWSITNSLNFAKVQSPFGNPNSITNITQAEYYFDTDPGFGNGVSIPNLVGAANFSNTSFNANVTSLPNGVHTLYIRTKDSLGKWSITNSLVFAKVQGLTANPNTTSNIVYLEYFVDIDPGFGNGVSVPIPSPAVNLSSISFNVDMTFLVNGNHELYMRSKDAQGKWSITNVFLFNGGMIPLSMKLISFDATVYEKNKALLTWVTENEHQVARYSIERSKDASSWEWVGNQAPKGQSTSSTNNYQLIDEQPGKGIIYYRLTEHDLNGKSTIAPIRFVRIDDAQTTASSLFPNPNDGKKVTIQSDLFAKEEVEISIMTSDGKLYFQQTIPAQGNATITIADLELAAATYFVNLKTKLHSQSLKMQVVGK